MGSSEKNVYHDIEANAGLKRIRNLLMPQPFMGPAEVISID